MAAVQYAKDQPAGFKNRIEKVAVVGAGGNMGGHIARALMDTGRHTVTAITREGSTSKLPEGVLKAPVNYDDHASLVKALKGQDFLVVTLHVAAPPDTTKKLFEAAAEAGIRYVMPNSYGPNASNMALLDGMGLGEVARAGAELTQRLGLRAVILSCGFWYEYSLARGTVTCGFDFKQRKVTFVGDGSTKIYTSTWPQTGRAAAALLSLPLLPQDAADKTPTLSGYLAPHTAYVSSFHVSQKDIFAVVKKVTGTTDADWTITYEDPVRRYENAVQAMQNGGGVALDGVTPMDPFDGFATRMYTRIFFPGGDGVSADQLDNDRFGLPKEDIEEWTREAIRLAESGELDAYGRH